MAVVTPSRHRVAMACQACGTVAWLYFTATPLPAPPGEWRVSVVTDPDDLVMLQLFAAAHRGPIARVT